MSLTKQQINHNTEPEQSSDNYSDELTASVFLEGHGIKLNIMDLEPDPNNETGDRGLVYKCPVCGEYELRNISIIDTTNDTYVDTKDWECDNPDCGAEFTER